MASIPRPVRFDVGTKWAGALDRVNEFMRDVRAALSGRLSVEQNLLMQWKEVPWTEGDTNVIVRTRFQQPVKGCSIQHLSRDDGFDESTWAITLQWEPATSDGQAAVKIRSIAGLATGERYTLRLLVIGG